MNYCLMRAVKGISLLILLAQALSNSAHAEEQQVSPRPLQEWSVEGQKSYVRTSMLMASVIASQTDKNLEKCLADWYAKTEEIARKREEQILGILRQNPEHMPAAIILAIIEKKCGAFPAR